MSHRAEVSNSNYSAISQALLFLADNFRRQPALAEAAAVAGLSPWHFQREFTRLAGVSPKAFVAHLTLERAKRALAQGRPILDAALDSGLSGPSRLYDLVLKVEAMTPGNYARRGAGLTICYGWHESLLGRALFAVTERGLCGLSFAAAGEERAQLADMTQRWPAARFAENVEETADFATRIFRHSSRPEPVPVQLFGTPWQIHVWKALLAIPAGSAVAYGTLAEKLCSARAARATASAIGRNPVALLIPCHRVITATGALGGYRWGETRKRALLALEAARFESAGGP
ncbi:MAG TPA: methylated-DNA--[protein]-cysteine S-methyltransferase [Micropepsaceae bacterium]|nr:methylated-DNA--[protein]-cysteine S-methyltransferase [Micropepsaceae bacterium]